MISKSFEIRVPLGKDLYKALLVQCIMDEVELVPTVIKMVEEFLASKKVKKSGKKVVSY